MLTVMLVCGCSSVQAQVPERKQDEMKQHTLVFSLSAPGEVKDIPRFGLDTSWPSLDNMRRGLLYMGKDRVNLVRVAFPANAPLIDGDLTPAKKKELDQRIEIARLAGDKPWTMMPDTEAGVDAYFKNGKEVIPERWAMLITAAQRHYGKKLEFIEAFNEPDYGWNQGTIQNLYDILGLLQKSPDFAGVKFAGPSTLSSDSAQTWYQPLKDRLQLGTTHALAGNFDNFLHLYADAASNGQIPFHPEVHNLVEVISGAEHGIQGAIWWGTAELARGEFVKAVHGKRLAYAEDLPRWSAAAVYRAPDGRVQAFSGNSERVGKDTTYRFVSKDHDVFFNGDGPRRDFTLPIRHDTETFVNITFGADVPPKIGGRYVIVNRASGKVLGVVGASKANSAAIEQMDYHRATNQQWEVSPLYTTSGDQSYFTLRALHSGRSLDMTGWSHAEGTRVQQWGEGAGTPQQWYFEYAGDNCFYIRSRWSTKCLEVASGSKREGAAIVQASPTSSPQQKWRLVPLSAWPIDFTPPRQPMGLTAMARPVSVELHWMANREPDIDSYTIFRATSPNGPYDTIARGIKATQFVDNQAREKKTYYYVIKAVDRSQNQSTYSTETRATPSGEHTLVLRYAFANRAVDSTGNANHPTLFGEAAYGIGHDGVQALILNGDDNYLRLPADVANSSEMTISTWLLWEGGSWWQRLFDFGNDESSYLFLTMHANGGGIRLAGKNGGEEQKLDGPALPEGEWVHVAVTVGKNSARLFVNGVMAAHSESWTLTPAEIRPVFNYIGKSQFVADPLFKGRLSDFRIYNYALTPDEIATVWKGSPVAPMPRR